MAQTQALSNVPPPTINRSLAAQRGTVTKSDFPKIGGKSVPSARALQKMANAQNINSEVVRLEWKNEGNFRTAMCTAYVRAWVGPRSKPRQEQTEALTMNIAAIAQKFVVKKLTDKQYPWPEEEVGLDEATGRLWPTGKRNQMALMSYLVDQFAFLDRLAITKAQARVYDKLLRPEADVHYGDEEAGYDGAHAGTVTPPDPEQPMERGPVPEDHDADASQPRAAAAVDAGIQDDAGGGDAPVGASLNPETGEPFGGEEGPAEGWPPSERELEIHRKAVEGRGAETVPVRKPDPEDMAHAAVAKAAIDVGLSPAAQTLVTEIQGHLGSKQALEGMRDRLKESKAVIGTIEHGEVMKVWWDAYRASK